MNDLLSRALNSEPIERPPVWFMRQAGRYLPEYHVTRAEAGSFLGLCRAPKLAAEVTLQPLRRFPLDASIVFNDILVPPAAMGMDLDFVAGKGPVFADPIRDVAQLKGLKKPVIAEDMPHVLETIKLLVAEIDVPLFGFAGAPYTLAAYMIEGSGSRHFEHVKAFSMHHPKEFHMLLDTLADICAEYLQAQVDAGCSAVQLFDTWAGDLSTDAFEKWALPYAKKALAGVSGVPRLYFTRNAAPYLHLIKGIEADAYAMDWHVDIARARKQLGDVPIMGNMDPLTLNGPPEVIKAEVHRIIRAAGPTGHVFNLGHGVLPITPIEGVHAMVDAVREWRW
ncbi:MAG: uroporphyrinogen decarboxylase [Proteobacteria bacterium]|nr:uroporphyrinogen decarboxylase [Pseudomonadota bacterium]MCP4918689.1 uroporphyrinogen decarboxylase [Pseudomonadota bacterium]